MKHSLKILDKNNMIKPMFVKANSHVIKKYDIETSNNKDQSLVDAWQKEYNAQVTNSSIVFETTTDQMMFTLKWGD
jgi:hypothetical protein